jgi:hypothetical protein
MPNQIGFLLKTCHAIQNVLDKKDMHICVPKVHQRLSTLQNGRMITREEAALSGINKCFNLLSITFKIKIGLNDL